MPLCGNVEIVEEHHSAPAAQAGDSAAGETVALPHQRHEESTPRAALPRRSRRSPSQTAPVRRLRKRRPVRGTRRGWSARPRCAYARHQRAGPGARMLLVRPERPEGARSTRSPPNGTACGSRSRTRSGSGSPRVARAGTGAPRRRPHLPRARVGMGPVCTSTLSSSRARSCSAATSSSRGRRASPDVHGESARLRGAPVESAAELQRLGQRRFAFGPHATVAQRPGRHVRKQSATRSPGASASHWRCRASAETPAPSITRSQDTAARPGRSSGEDPLGAGTPVSARSLSQRSILHGSSPRPLLVVASCGIVRVGAWDLT